MSTLHVINHSPSASDGLSTCLRIRAEGDVILLIEDGVYAALAHTETARSLAGTASALLADVQARGLTDRLGEAIGIVDDAGFVELCIRCDRVMSWF